MTEYFGPVLGIMRADSLDHAIELQNATPFGLTAGLFSLDPDELARWCAGVEAGNLYINRGITGAIVRRQPFGGWKRSAVGAGTKAGGPNYLVGLTNWRTRQATSSAEIGPSASRLLRAARDAGLAGLDRIERALRSDATAWTDEFGTARDVSGLEAERNVLRYRPHGVVVRLASDSVANLVRVVAAGVTAGADIVASSAVELPEPVRKAFTACAVDVFIENRAQWENRLRALPSGRIRLIGGTRRRSTTCSADGPTSRSTPSRSPNRGEWKCCRSCASKRSASPPTGSALPIAWPTNSVTGAPRRGPDVTAPP